MSSLCRFCLHVFAFICFSLVSQLFVEFKPPLLLVWNSTVLYESSLQGSTSLSQVLPWRLSELKIWSQRFFFFPIISLNPSHGFQNEVLPPCFSSQRLLCLLLPLPYGVLAPIVPMTLLLPLCLGSTSAIFLWKLSFRARDIAQWLGVLSTHTEAWGLVPNIHIVAHNSRACHSSSRASDALSWPPYFPASTWDTWNSPRHRHTHI